MKAAGAPETVWRETVPTSMGAAAAASLPRAGKQPLYLSICGHGGLALWDIPHFAKKLREAITWLDRYPGFEISPHSVVEKFLVSCYRSPDSRDGLCFAVG